MIPTYFSSDNNDFVNTFKVHRITFVCLLLKGIQNLSFVNKYVKYYYFFKYKFFPLATKNYMKYILKYLEKIITPCDFDSQASDSFGLYYQRRINISYYRIVLHIFVRVILHKIGVLLVFTDGLF